MAKERTMDEYRQSKPYGYKPPADGRECSHSYSKSMTEPRPRLCTKCGTPEICKACQGEDTLHMCGKVKVLDTEKLVYTEADMHYAIAYAVAHPKITANESKQKVEAVIDWINASK